ncbi:MAG: hypothetical protein K5767_03590 [Clostridia bacterium]|nr:hypothetical protein [Clostridia bacterium]
MNLELIMADPAGNKTAIVLSPVDKKERAAVAAAIMKIDELGAEQVAFEVPPRKVKNPADGRLEMMGGEFCGNAARAYGMYICNKNGTDTCRIEMSGAKKALTVSVDREKMLATAEMPKPERIKYANIMGAEYPIVESAGIAHLIANGLAPDSRFEEFVFDRHKDSADAFGIQYVMFTVPGDDEEVDEPDDNRISRSHHEHWFSLEPVVHVKATGTTTRESSCASGSTAAAWYMSGDDDEGTFTYHFDEPGGRLTVRIIKDGKKKQQCTIEGPVSLSEPRTVSVEI